MFRPFRRHKEPDQIFFWMMEAGKHYRVIVYKPEGAVTIEGEFSHYKQDFAVFNGGRWIQRNITDQANVIEI